MKTIVQFLKVAALICAFCSCGKSQPDTAEELTQLLTAHKWHIRQASVTPPMYSPILGNSTTDYFTYFIPNCVYDNYWHFSDNKTYEWNEGATRCNDTDPQTMTRKWSFSLTFDAINTSELDGSQAINYRLLLLTDYSLKVRRTIELNDNLYEIEEMYHPE